jgi:NADPH:quinone reductase
VIIGVSITDVSPVGLGLLQKAGLEWRARCPFWVGSRVVVVSGAFRLDRTTKELLMKAVQIRAHGGPDVLEYVDVAEPVAGPGQILIRVESAAVNFSDTMRRSNAPYPFPTVLPFIPGGEVAGTVEALGEGVDGPAVGTAVFALAGPDGQTGYAQYCVANAQMVIPRPPTVSADEAAAIMVAGGTAMIMLKETARLSAGESVLIEGAGGGVGTYAVQIAKALKAGVIIGTAGSHERRIAALALGADHAIDYTLPDWADRVRVVVPGGVDVVLQMNGAPTMSTAFSTLGLFGRMIVFGYASGQQGSLTPEEQHGLFYAPVLNQSVTGFNIGLYFGVRPDLAVPALTELIGLVASRQVIPRIGQVLPLADAAKAHAMLADRASIGKIILKPWNQGD